MQEAPVHWLAAHTPDSSGHTTRMAQPRRIALLGNPNCGKTALFNLLTGSRQKVANYPGVTVERKSGTAVTPSGRTVEVLDLPGTYSLNATANDEAITRKIVSGNSSNEPVPDLLVCVTDASKLRLGLQLVLEARHLGLPMLLVLNMCDIIRAEGIEIDTAALSAALGNIPIVEAVGIHSKGAAAVLAALDTPVPVVDATEIQPLAAGSMDQVCAIQRQVCDIVRQAVHDPLQQCPSNEHIDRIDRVALHPVWGMLLLFLTLFLVFQAVFSLAKLPMDLIETGIGMAAEWVAASMPEGMLRSLLADGIISGAGGVLVFLPQILILFFFILLLEDTGYLPRAAFLLDRLMGKVGLSGRSFIPLLSSFACAIPGIMATRSISSWRDRFVTILIAPLMTCSARLPVYALLIAAFIPDRRVAGIFNLQGLVLLGLYLLAIASAMLVALALRMLHRPHGQAGWHDSPLLLELSAYRWPNLRSLAYGLAERAWLFLRKVGTLILALSVLLWFLSTYPAPPANATGPAIQYSLAGRLGGLLLYVLAPIGFNWQIAISLVPGMAAREVMVGALGTVYALSGSDSDIANTLAPVLAREWSLATGLSVLAWFVYAPQCLPMLAAIKRETNSWRTAAGVTAYLFGLAYVASFITYRLTLALT